MSLLTSISKRLILTTQLQIIKIIIRVNSSGDIFIAKIDRPNCFNRFHSETMLLLAALCMDYCSKFVICTIKKYSYNKVLYSDDCAKYNITAAKKIYLYIYGQDAYINTDYLYCLDHKETDELSEPGYLCDGIGEFQYCKNAGKKLYYIDRLLYDWYCCDQKYIPMPTKSPVPPRTPWRTRTFMPTPVSTHQRTEIKTPDPSVIPVTKNNKNNIANLVSFFVLTSLT